jgi:hypothetical protein
MNLTKNQIYIISSVIIIAVIYFMFFRKKTTSLQAAKMATPPATPGESNWFGENWGWNGGPGLISEHEALVSASGPASNSVAGLPGILGNPPESNWEALRTEGIPKRASRWDRLNAKQPMPVGQFRSAFPNLAMGESNYASAWDIFSKTPAPVMSPINRISQNAPAQGPSAWDVLPNVAMGESNFSDGSPMPWKVPMG